MLDINKVEREMELLDEAEIIQYIELQRKFFQDSIITRERQGFRKEHSKKTLKEIAQEVSKGIQNNLIKRYIYSRSFSGVDRNLLTDYMLLSDKELEEQLKEKGIKSAMGHFKEIESFIEKQNRGIEPGDN